MNEDLMTSPGLAVGTVNYMSPEQARGQDIDARTDLFSFGVVLYEMATGRLPFPGATHAIVFDGILNRAPEPPTRVNPALAMDFEPIIRKAMEKDREVRYQSAADLAADLKKLRRDTGRSSASLPISAMSPVRKSRWIWPAVAALLIALAALAGFRLLRPVKNADTGLTWTQITSFTDVASAPALSPDGRMLAFTRGDSWFVDHNEIYVKMLPDGQAVQLTHDGRPKMYLFLRRRLTHRLYRRRLGHLGSPGAGRWRTPPDAAQCRRPELDRQPARDVLRNQKVAAHGGGDGE